MNSSCPSCLPAGPEPSMVQGRQVWLCGEDPNPTPSLLSEGFFSDILQLLFQSLLPAGPVSRGYGGRPGGICNITEAGVLTLLLH